MSPLTVLAFAVGTSLGWGSLVVTSSTYLKQAGPWGSVFGLLIGAAVMMLVCWSYHYLANRYPEGTGIYYYIKRVFGYDRAFIISWFFSFFMLLYSGQTQHRSRFLPDMYSEMYSVSVIFIPFTGYPEKLKGEEIPLEARIMAIADVYDALVSKRVYKDKMSFETANKIMTEGSGTQFDSRFLAVFEKVRPSIEAYYSEL